MAKIEELEVGDRLILRDSQGMPRLALVCRLDLGEDEIVLSYINDAYHREIEPIVSCYVDDEELKGAVNKDAELRRLLGQI